MSFLECPQNLQETLNSTSANGIKEVSFPHLVAIDNPDLQIAVECNPPSGSNFTIGSTPVICDATDKYENTDTCNFDVEIVQ